MKCPIRVQTLDYLNLSACIFTLPPLLHSNVSGLCNKYFPNTQQQIIHQALWRWWAMCETALNIFQAKLCFKAQNLGTQLTLNCDQKGTLPFPSPLSLFSSPLPTQGILKEILQALFLTTFFSFRKNYSNSHIRMDWRGQVGRLNMSYRQDVGERSGFKTLQGVWISRTWGLLGMLAQ